MVKPPTSKTVTSTGPSIGPKDKNKDKPKITVAMIQDLAEELQGIEQESLNDSHDSEVTQESDLEQEDSEDRGRAMTSHSPNLTCHNV